MLVSILQSVPPVYLPVWIVLISSNAFLALMGLFYSELIALLLAQQDSTFRILELINVMHVMLLAWLALELSLLAQVVPPLEYFIWINA